MTPFKSSLNSMNKSKSILIDTANYEWLQILKMGININFLSAC